MRASLVALRMRAIAYARRALADDKRESFSRADVRLMIRDTFEIAYAAAWDDDSKRQRS